MAQKCCRSCTFECRWLQSAETTCFCVFLEPGAVDFGCLASKCYANLIFNMERERERERERAQCLKSLAHLRSKFLFLKRASRSHAKTGKFWPKVNKKASRGMEADFFSCFLGVFFRGVFRGALWGAVGSHLGAGGSQKGAKTRSKSDNKRDFF